MKPDIATLEYNVVGRSPVGTGRNLLSRCYRSDEVRIENCLPMMVGGMRDTAVAEITDNVSMFKSQTKQYRAGGNTKTQLTFPMRFGAMTYINTFPTTTHLNILFRHDSCVATSYKGDGEGGTYEHDNHYQPQVYVMVKINLEDGEKSYILVNTRFMLNGRTFPHNSSDSRNLFSGFCDGEYGDQIRSALKMDDLSVFLSVFSMYIMHGTRADDEYGRSCSNFVFGAELSPVHIVVNSEFEAQVAAYIFSDPETPHEIKTSRQSLTMTFTTPLIEMEYLRLRYELSQGK